MELKPCPFCGGEMTMIYNSADKAFKFYHKNGFDGVECPILEPFMIDSESLATAAEAWNRRLSK